MGQHELILYGAFKAMGDFLSAAPVIRTELDSGSQVCVLIFPGLEAFTQLIDFGESAANLRIISLPVSGLGSLRTFLNQMQDISPTVVWVSPHAPAPASSWKIPLLLRIAKALYWPGAVLAGSKSERMSFLFDVRSTVSRALPFAEREWQSYSVLNRIPAWQDRLKLRFRSGIQDESRKTPLYDLLIHPGAGAANRKWPFSHYPPLIERLAPSCRIGVVGLPEDVAAMRDVLPPDRGIQFISGTLEQSIQAIARARVLLTMDSGNMFFADMLKVPAIAIFGASNPANVIGPGRTVIPIYQKSVSCQPCGKKTCIHAEPKCITSISPAYVADQLMKMMDRSAQEVAGRTLMKS